MSATSQQQQTPARREGLSFATSDDVVADINRLRRGYAKCGSWSLPAMCYHLESTLKARMTPGPFPPNTPEQDAARPKFQQVLASGKLPKIDAPAPFLPSANVDESAIDAFIATLKRFDAYGQPFAPHRIFGNLSPEEIRRLNLIHCAHHLSYLVPV
jgi:hypothetical protein